ncbi:MAG: 5-formyltetrahydrofolate cyclo-ligase [Porticoccaceae bacterium]|nr:5-formyltetrahydrofolate cyclo-ligase [Pseudomonadales bacterium]
MSSHTIRQQLRRQRSLLSARQQTKASSSLTRNLARLPVFRQSRRIAFYLANNGEIDPFQAIEDACAAGKKCYLPVLHPLKFNRLYFARYRPGQRLHRNRFGIPEPRIGSAQRVAPWSLDLILLPLVAFDSQCNRIGMGGGFYDRTLAFTRHRSGGPKLVGLAHSFQQVKHIETENWDIPLNCVVTETGTIAANPEICSAQY